MFFPLLMPLKSLLIESYITSQETKKWTLVKVNEKKQFCSLEEMKIDNNNKQ